MGSQNDFPSTQKNLGSKIDEIAYQTGNNCAMFFQLSEFRVLNGENGAAL